MRMSIVTMAVALLAGGFARADQGAPAGTPVALLAHERVQKELKLSDEQTTALKGLAAAVKKGDSKPADAAETVGKTLKEAQLARLEEISYQVRGGSALSDEKVSAALKLTKEQASQIVDSWKKEEQVLSDFLARARFSSAAAMQEHVRKHRKTAAAKLLDVLSEEQKKQFTQMQGKAFETAGLDKE